MIRHALSFDVENWYDGNLQRGSYRGPRDDRVEAETEAVVETLAAAETRATFFVLGRVAVRFPGLIRSLEAAGHEVASHGFDHELVYRQTPQQFGEDITRARVLLEDLIGVPVLGYRAPSWSLTSGTLSWAPAVIAAAGYKYDSSVFPMLTPFYGVTGAPTQPWAHRLPSGGRLPELPPAVLKAGPLRIPFGGGIYWRLLPESALACLLGRSGSASVLYLHPWELNSAAPPNPVGLGLIPRLVLTVGIRRSMGLLSRMLTRFSFGPIRTVFARELEKEAEE